MTFTGATVDIASTGTLAANNLVGDPGALTTAIGSLVRFNQFTGNTSSTASFGGGLAIGYYTGPTGGLVAYDPVLTADSHLDLEHRRKLENWR